MAVVGEGRLPFYPQRGGRKLDRVQLWHLMQDQASRHQLRDALISRYFPDHRAQLDALAIFENLGASPAAERLRHKLRAIGMRGIPRGPRPSTKENPAGLTSRQMEVLSTQPAVVVYTANHFDGTIRGKGGIVYPKHAGLCVEPAHLPNAVNHPEWPFPSDVLRPRQTYQQTIVYCFSTR